MANTFYIRVVVDPSGAARGTSEVGKHLEAMNRKAEKSFNLLRAYFAFNMAQNIASKVIDVVDAYTSLENKVRSATSTQEEFDYAMQKIPEVAKRSRGDLEAVGKAYQALTLSTQSMGLSQDQVLRMVETLQKSMIVSGSTSEEAASVMLQFSQALRKGKLDGDEFRSVMENNIEVQKLLASAMGISTDQLVGMSKAGKITRDVMVKALLEGAESIDEKFGKTIPTISEQITLFKNEMILLAGEFNKSAHLGELFGLMFQKVTEYAKTAVTVIGGLVGVVVDLENKLNQATGGGSRQVMGFVEEVASTVTSPLKQVEYLIKGYDELRAHSERLTNAQIRGNMGEAGLLIIPPQFDKQIDLLGDAREELDLVTIALQKASQSQGFLSLMGELGVEAKKRADDLRDMAEAINLVNDALVRAGQAANLVSWLGGTGEKIAAQEQGLRDMAAAVDSVNEAVKRGNAAGAFNEFANGAKSLGNVFEAVVTGKPLDEVYAAAAGPGQATVIDAFLGKGKSKKGPKDTFPDELTRLRGSIDSVWEAQNKLAEAEKTLDKGRARGLITLDEENRLLGLYRLQLEDALNPAKKFIDNMREEAFYTRLRVQYTNEESYAAEIEYRKEVVELQKLGLELTREEFFAADRQRHQSEKLAEAARKMDDDKQALLDGLGIVSRDEQFYKEMAKLQRRTGVIFDNKGAATGNEDQLKQYLDGLAELQKQDRAGAFAPKFLTDADIYAQKIDMLNEAVASNKLPMELYGQALHKIDEEMGLVYDKSIQLTGIQEGLADGWRKINEQTADLATTVSAELVGAFDRMTDAIVEFVTTGKFSWDSFVQSLLAGVARIATQYLLLQILGMFAGGGPGFNIVGGPGGGLVGNGLLEPTFAAKGLDGVVRGSAGNDTNFLPLMVSNGERVTVTPTGQQERVSSGGGSVKIVNIYEDRGAQIALMQSPANERAVLNHLRRNPALARGLR